MWKIVIPIEPPREPTEEERQKEIIDWVVSHDAYDWSPKDIAKTMAIEAIENTIFAEDAYPGLKQKMLDHIRNF